MPTVIQIVSPTGFFPLGKGSIFPFQKRDVACLLARFQGRVACPIRHLTPPNMKPGSIFLSLNFQDPRFFFGAPKWPSNAIFSKQMCPQSSRFFGSWNLLSCLYLLALFQQLSHCWRGWGAHAIRAKFQETRGLYICAFFLPIHFRLIFHIYLPPTRPSIIPATSPTTPCPPPMSSLCSFVFSFPNPPSPYIAFISVFPPRANSRRKCSSGAGWRLTSIARGPCTQAGWEWHGHRLINIRF